MKKLAVGMLTAALLAGCTDKEQVEEPKAKVEVQETTAEASSTDATEQVVQAVEVVEEEANNEVDELAEEIHTSTESFSVQEGETTTMYLDRIFSGNDVSTLQQLYINKLKNVKVAVEQELAGMSDETHGNAYFAMVPDTYRQHYEVIMNEMITDLSLTFDAQMARLLAEDQAAWQAKFELESQAYRDETVAETGGGTALGEVFATYDQTYIFKRCVQIIKEYM